jgi:hypothetical protein
MLKSLLMIIFSAGLSAYSQQLPQDNAGSDETETTAFHGRTVMPIELNELPDDVARVITAGEFRTWRSEEAYRIHGGSERAEGQASYIIVMVKRGERLALYFDENGRLIRQEKVEFQETSE